VLGIKLNLVDVIAVIMEEFYCNICQRTIESASMENHIKESDHVTRKRILERDLETNKESEKSKLSVVELWKNH